MDEECLLLPQLRVTLREPISIGPAHPTPQHIIHLSNLDTLPVTFGQMVQTIYLYEGVTKAHWKKDAAIVLKEALSDVLIYYYPLAGRFRFSSEGRLELDCNEEGILFVEGETNMKLADLGEIEKPHSSMKKLVYTIPGAKNFLQIPPLVVQVTKFSCGGFALGMEMSHSLTDGNGAMQFLKAWADMARGERIPSLIPCFDRTPLLPRIPAQIEFTHNEFLDVKDLSNLDQQLDALAATTEFVFFKPTMVSYLKKQALKESDIQSFTSFEVLAAHIWRCRTLALDVASNQVTKLLFAVNIRDKLDPPLSDRFWGNAIIDACAVSSAEELRNNPLSYAVKLVKEAKAYTNERYVRSVIDFLEVKRPATPATTGVVMVSSWSRFAYYSIDFGWGKPIYAGPVKLDVVSEILFLPSKEPNGIIVMLALPECAVKKFRQLATLGFVSMLPDDRE